MLCGETDCSKTNLLKNYIAERYITNQIQFCFAYLPLHYTMYLVAIIVQLDCESAATLAAG